MTEREWDKRLRIKTIGREDEANANYSPYEPTPYPVLERLAQSGYIRRKNYLLDYGCGKGRVAFFMASAVGCRVNGIDQSQKLIDIAKENRRSCRAGDRVALFCRLAEQHELTGEDAFFFFNPFSEKVFEGVLRRIIKSWYERPRKIVLLCYYPSQAYIELLENAPEISRLEGVDCRDLFNAKNPREYIAVYALSEGG